MSDTPIKNCDYCGVLGKMPTFMSGETICYSCLSKQPKSITGAFKEILKLQSRVKVLEDALNEALDNFGANIADSDIYAHENLKALRAIANGKDNTCKHGVSKEFNCNGCSDEKYK